jgi:hypothetical protein
VYNTFGPEQRESAAPKRTTHNHPKLDCGDPVEIGGFRQQDGTLNNLGYAVDAEGFGRAGS